MFSTLMTIQNEADRLLNSRKGYSTRPVEGVYCNVGRLLDVHALREGRVHATSKTLSVSSFSRDPLLCVLTPGFIFHRNTRDFR